MADSVLPPKKIAVLGDSHCRGMADALKLNNKDIQTLSIIHPRGTLAISAKYQTTSHIVYTFDPDFIYIHCGHNDLVYHPSLNQTPINSQDSRTHTISLAQLIQRNHPRSKVIISALFPRTFTFKSPLDEEEVAAFNRLAKRHGQRLRAEASQLPTPIQVSLNNPIWNRISRAEEKSQMFLKDGLHLTDNGKLAIAAAWLNDISIKVQLMTPDHPCK